MPETVTGEKKDYEVSYAPVLNEVQKVVTSGYDFDKKYKYISDDKFWAMMDDYEKQCKLLSWTPIGKYVSKASSASAEITAYAKFLSTYMEHPAMSKTLSEEFGEEDKPESLDGVSFTLIYVDDDEIPELAVANGDAPWNPVHVFSYKDGEVKETGEYSMYGKMYYSPKKGYILPMYYIPAVNAEIEIYGSDKTIPFNLDRDSKNFISPSDYNSMFLSDAKEPVAEKSDDAQCAEDFDLYSALAGEDFELSSVNTYYSNYRTWIKFKEDGSFSGSFIKDYYVESADGQADGQADGSFTGKLGKCTQVDQYTWKADIEELNYDVSADVPKEYSSASGLEGYDNGSTEMTFHLPGKDVEALPGDVSSWLFGNDFGAYVGYDMDWVLDTPLDLPFYVVSTKDGCFSGRNVSGKNELCIINKAKLPGFTNQELTINPDGTYTCIDADGDGNIKFTNTCFEYNGFDVDVEECIKKIYGNIDYEYISIYGNGGENDEDEWIYKPDWKWLNGMKSKYAFWSVGENDNYVFYQGRFVSPYIDDDRYVFAYIMEYHGPGKAVDAETAYMALGALTFSGKKEEISCAGGKDGQPYKELLIYCLSGQGRSILGDEVEFVHEGETEKIEKYGLDPNEFYDDYQIGGYDGVYDEYKLTSECPIYVQYAPDGLHRLLTLEEFNSYVPATDQDGGRLMRIVLDKDEKVILISEPYTP